jgi:DNA polymerase-3 subunit delta'
MALAMDLAQALNCKGEDKPCGLCDQCSRTARGVHADVKVVGVASGESGDGRSRVAIGIDQIRNVQRDASLKPYEGRYRVFIFDGAEHLSEEAANSLLKTLEEPPDQVMLILLSSDAAALPATVVSRCQLLELRPVARSLIASHIESRLDVDSETADEIARLSEGRPGWAIDAATRPEVLERLSERLGTIEEIARGGPERRFAYAADLASDFGKDRDSARRELAIWLSWWRDVLLVKSDVSGFVTHLSRTETLRSVAYSLSSEQVVQAVNAVHETIDYLERNVNPRLALEALMLQLPRP